MKNNLYVIYDTLSQRYGQVFSSPTDATAIRYFNGYCASVNGYQQGDSELCRCGTIGVADGVVVGSSPVRVAMPVVDKRIDAIEQLSFKEVLNG